MDEKKIKELERQANDIRITLIEALVEAGSGHTAGPLGMADIFTYLYFHELRHDPKNPQWPDCGPQISAEKKYNEELAKELQRELRKET